MYRSWAHAALSSGPLVTSECGSLRGRTQITLIHTPSSSSSSSTLSTDQRCSFFSSRWQKAKCTRRQRARPATWNTGLFNLWALPLQVLPIKMPLVPQFILCKIAALTLPPLFLFQTFNKLASLSWAFLFCFVNIHSVRKCLDVRRYLCWQWTKGVLN